MYLNVGHLFWQEMALSEGRFFNRDLPAERVTELSPEDFWPVEDRRYEAKTFAVTSAR